MSGKIIEISDIAAGLDALHANGGIQRGLSTGWSSMDEFLRILRGLLYVLTGFPNHGKSTWLDNLLINLAVLHNWKIAVFSAENEPFTRYVASLVEIYTGRPFSKGPTTRLTREEARDAEFWLNEHFKILNPAEDERTVAGLLEVSQLAIDTHGVDAIVWDPWNEISHAGRPPHLREDEYISAQLSKARTFARSNNVALFIVAHPAKIQRDGSGKHPVPTMFDIKGASEWNSKADVGICVWRDMLNPENGTDVHIQKMRFREGGKIGGCRFQYDVVNGRFIDPNHRPNVDELIAKQARLSEPFRGQF